MAAAARHTHLAGRGHENTADLAPGAADMALLAFADGLALSEDAVRAAFTGAISGIRLADEHLAGRRRAGGDRRCQAAGGGRELVSAGTGCP